MYFDDLPTELVANVFFSCSTITDVTNLSTTCKHFRSVYVSRKLQFLEDAAEEQYGPIQDAIQLATHNSSQPAHILRSVPTSFALLKQVVALGRIASKWEGLYPFKKWKGDESADRRLLTPKEKYIFRRAIYRIWLYGKAFHNPMHPRGSRMHPNVVRERSELLHNWNNVELAEMADVSLILRDIVGNSVCPSNGTIQRKFRKRFPETNHQLLFNMHVNYPPPASSFFHNQNVYTHQGQPISSTRGLAKYRPTAWHEPGGEGWGDDISHYYVVEDMLKLDPGQILWLKDNAMSKYEVVSYVKSLGEWFDNNGETFGQTLEIVLSERGADACEFMEAVVSGEVGVARAIEC